MQLAVCMGSGAGKGFGQRKEKNWEDVEEGEFRKQAPDPL